MSERYDCSDPEQRKAGIAAAVAAVQKGELVVLPTDTVYGIGADAFTSWAVSRLLAAKGRGRDMPPPVLVGTVRAANALVDDMGSFGQDLIDQFWPGGLTLVCRSSPTLAWDLGDTRGTVAVRMPLHAVALDLLKRTGPMAVSSANRTGQPAATTADEALDQLGDSVAVYLDGGPCPGGVASTIIDLTGSVPRLLRAGVIPMDRLREVAALVTGEDVPVSASASANGSAGVPDVPDGAGVPDVPGLPDGAGVPDVPNGADVPDVPGLPDGAGIPDVPGLPDGAGIPDVPGVPDGADVPGVPGLPDGAGVPGVRGRPGRADVPGMSKVAEAPGPSGDPAGASAPVAADDPGLPKGPAPAPSPASAGTPAKTSESSPDAKDTAGK
jgi:tRNA threonylcarbamoyl adenosine modification protein (Sua5/YciO/YrdC/YwlC family)